MRTLATAALVAQVAFVVAWIVAGALQPGYSHSHWYVSELGAATARHPWIVNTAIVTLGLGIAALGVALRMALPRSRASTWTAVLFVVAGMTLAAAGPVNLDCMPTERACEHAWKAGELSWQTDGHMWLSFVGQILFSLTPFLIARALWPSPAAALALAAGATGLAIGVVSFALEDGRGGFPDGLVQRFDLLVLQLWVVIVAVGVLWALRRDPEPGPLVPLRPREFLAGEWTGEGDLVLRPLWLGKRFPQRFTARRATRSITENVWKIEDSADFGNGRVQRRDTFCEFVANDHLVLTAADLPDGAELWLDEGGYRTAPFRMAFPIGPLPVLVRVHDSSYAEDDGVFVNRYDAYALGTRIPLARTTFRVRPGAS
jgi:hypothetical protein